MSEKALENLGAAAVILGGVAVEIERLTKQRDALEDAATRMRDLINMAGLQNLTNGVQLGQISWMIKMNDALTQCETALATLEDKS